MKTKHYNVLATTLQGFLSDYLPRVRGASPHTVLAYRDSFKLFLHFLAQQKGKPVSDLDIECIDIAEILAFLEGLETNRRNTISTRNVRLSAIQSLFRYLAGSYPEYLDKCQRVLNIPSKRMPTRTVEYFEFEEIRAVLQVVDRSKTYGRRDYALLSVMFNTGARAQEVVDLKATDLQLTRPFSVNINGKGKKERICPLWPQTAHVLREYLEERDIDSQRSVHVFINHLGKPLTRFGIRYILAKYVRLAISLQSSLKKKSLHPHSVRHSTALHLLKSGVDLSTISHWLGHSSINTTNKYVTINLEMKRKALEKAKPLSSKTATQASWRKNSDILKWLESL